MSPKYPYRCCCSFPQSAQLRFLVHLIGDIHQPLHVLNYFDSNFPSGDQSALSSPLFPLGGNLFFVQTPGEGASQTTNLHAWTDGCAGFFSDCKELPIVGTSPIVNRRKRSTTRRSRTRRARSRCCATSRQHETR